MYKLSLQILIFSLQKRNLAAKNLILTINHKKNRNQNGF